MRTMKEIYKDLEEQLKAAADKEMVLRKDKETKENEINELMAELEDIQVRYTKAKDNMDAIQGAMDNLMLGDYSEEMEAAEEKTVEIVTDEKNLVWHTKDPMILKIGEKGDTLGKYHSRKEAANSLRVSVATVANYLKQPIELQISKRRFALKYEY